MLHNNLTQYKDMQKSMYDSTMEYELIGIDNRDAKYKSAASALNVGGKAHGEI